jgi:hypothetical protein
MKKILFLILTVLLVLSGCTGKNSLKGLEETEWSILEKPIKTLPVGDDALGIEDSEANYVIKHVLLKDLPVSTPTEDRIVALDTALKAYGDENWLNTGTGSGLETFPTGLLQALVSTGVGEGQYGWTPYSTLKADLGVPISGTDFYSIAGTDALITPTVIAEKLTDQPISPSTLLILPNSIGAQFVELGIDTDLGQGKVGHAAPDVVNSSYMERLPSDPPQEGDIKRYHAPVPFTGSDGIVRQGADSYYEQPGAGTLVGLTDYPEGLPPANLNALLGIQGNIQDQIQAIQGFVWDEFPLYIDSPCNGTGLAKSETALAVCVEIAGVKQWKNIPFGTDLGSDPGGPAALSFKITGDGPQYGTIVYDRPVTAPIVADLCAGWNIELQNAGTVTLTNLGGNNTDTTVCSILEDVYQDDPIVAANYTPGTIESSTGGVALAAIADFANKTENNSTEISPAIACGSSTRTVNADFESSLAGFNADVGTWSVSGGSAVTSSTGYRTLRSTTSLNSDCQWADTTTSSVLPNAAAQSLILRASGVSGNKYVVQVYGYSSTISRLSIRTYNGSTDIGLIGSIIEFPKWTTPTRLVAQVNGTGTSTVFKIWIGKVGETPIDLGEPDYIIDADPGTPVDSGQYAGIFTVSPAGIPMGFTEFNAGN